MNQKGGNAYKDVEDHVGESNNKSQDADPQEFPKVFHAYAKNLSEAVSFALLESPCSFSQSANRNCSHNNEE